MSGTIEYGTCELCGREAELKRKYYNYATVCTCHSQNHFEVVKYCKDCVPVEPKMTKIEYVGGITMWYNTDTLKRDLAAINKFGKEQMKKLLYGTTDNR